MEKENTQEQPIDMSLFTAFAGVSFLNTNSRRTYYFGLEDNLQVQIGDKVVVETAQGLEIGEVSIPSKTMDQYTSNLGLRPIIRIADKVDIQMFETNKKDAAEALIFCRQEVEKLNLNMSLLYAEYTLDRTKLLFVYIADERVDFRELLKILASKFRTRIELRQIGSRDKAKAIGGLGICGLPLCCSTFLHEFDGISISRAKNQMLAINIPKLSGQCGKLMCCLKFEDDAYTDAKQYYPELGTKVSIDQVEYTVTSLNVISRTVKIENAEDIKFLDLKTFKEQTGWRRKKEIYDKK